MPDINDMLELSRLFNVPLQPCKTPGMLCISNFIYICVFGGLVTLFQVLINFQRNCNVKLNIN